MLKALLGPFVGVIPKILEEQGDFTVLLDDGRKAECWQAMAQPYKDCVFSAGSAEGIEPDTVYFRLSRDGEEEPWTFFFRPDEMLAMLFVCSSALWCQELMERYGPPEAKDAVDDAD